jgi:hypothetical protein
VISFQNYLAALTKSNSCATPYNEQVLNFYLTFVSGAQSRKVNPVWKILYFLSCSFIPCFFFVHFTSPPIFCHHIKLYNILILTRIGSAPPLPSGSAHLFGINAGVPHCVELVFTWLLNSQDRIKVIKLMPWPLFPHLAMSQPSFVERMYLAKLFGELLICFNYLTCLLDEQSVESLPKCRGILALVLPSKLHT